jgi:ligand-binding SRPBCC domain-containing protein
MAMHVLHREQLLKTTLSEAWDFVIREPFDDRPAHTGQLITYSVRPLLGIPLTWVTRIEEVEAPFKFVDTQLRGPYKRWWHEHTFEAVEGGVLMRDRVEYELPLGPLGELMHDLLVKGRLKRIFDHRWAVLEVLFGPKRTASGSPVF